jgi:hypothetical protein
LIPGLGWVVTDGGATALSDPGACLLAVQAAILLSRHSPTTAVALSALNLPATLLAVISSCTATCLSWG